MNILEKQAELSRTLFEINMQTMQNMLKVQQDDIKKYLDLNTNFGQKLPEVDGIGGFMELQREYGEALWQNLRTGTETQADIVRTAIEDAGVAVRTAFSAEEESAPAE
jgi:hypothetical protein